MGTFDTVCPLVCKGGGQLPPGSTAYVHEIVHYISCDDRSDSLCSLRQNYTNNKESSIADISPTTVFRKPVVNARNKDPLQLPIAQW